MFLHKLQIITAFGKNLKTCGSPHCDWDGALITKSSNKRTICNYGKYKKIKKLAKSSKSGADNTCRGDAHVRCGNELEIMQDNYNGTILLAFG